MHRERESPKQRTKEGERDASRTELRLGELLFSEDPEVAE